MIDAVIEGTLNTKTLEATIEFFKETTMNNYQWHNSRAKFNKLTHVYDVDPMDTSYSLLLKCTP